MDELIAFLRRCLDEDEQTASIISPGGYQAQTWRTGPDGPGHVGVLMYADDLIIGDPPEAVERGEEPFAVVIGGRAEHAHIARWDPARVLAEVEAKRQMLDFLDPTDAPEGEGKYVAERAIVLLAQPYAGQPGWREEWRI